MRQLFFSLLIGLTGIYGARAGGVARAVPQVPDPVRTWAVAAEGGVTVHGEVPILGAAGERVGIYAVFCYNKEPKYPNV